MKPDNSFFQLSTRKKLHRNNVNFHHIFILYPLRCLTLNQLPLTTKEKIQFGIPFELFSNHLRKYERTFHHLTCFQQVGLVLYLRQKAKYLSALQNDLVILLSTPIKLKLYNLVTQPAQSSHSENRNLSTTCEIFSPKHGWS